MDIGFQGLKNAIRGEAFLSFLWQAQRENEEAERETERKLKDGWQVQDRKQRQLKQTLVLYSRIIVIILLQHTLALYTCIKLLHNTLASYSCIKRLHHDLASYSCIILLQHTLALCTCIILLHNNLASYSCIIRLHMRNTLAS